VPRSCLNSSEPARWLDLDFNVESPPSGGDFFVYHYIDAALDACYKNKAGVVETMATAKRKHAKAQPEVVIPEKIYFRIGEVSELAALPTYVLRFWETEFAQLKPTKSSTGQRMYRRKDVEYVMRIRKLLYEDGFTIAGAREKLREEIRSHRTPEQPLPHVVMQKEALRTEVLHKEPMHENVSVKDQATLPFLAPAPSAPAKDELQRVRQQLRAVLDLLS